MKLDEPIIIEEDKSEIPVVKPKRSPRGKQIKISPKTLKNILIYRIRGNTLDSIASMFGLGSRQAVDQMIRRHEKNSKLSYLYDEIKATRAFLNRKITSKK